MTIKKEFLMLASETEARKLVQKHGYLKAFELATYWRDESSPGTLTFALHNDICKALVRFATVGRLNDDKA